jgi:segregation and condensation protein B
MSSNPQLTPEPPQQPAVSLKELSEAFAQAMGYQPGPPAEEPVAEAPAQTPAEPAVEEADTCPISPQTILEAMLFVGNREGLPLAGPQAAELMRGVEPGEIGPLVDALNRRYQERGCPYHVVEEGPGYRLTLRKSFGSLRDRFYGRVREARLSQAAVDVLAIVAYRQPVTAEQIRALRGKPSGRILSQLVRRGLLRVERPEGKGRKIEYYTAARFLELFGIESLADLPQSEEPP